MDLSVLRDAFGVGMDRALKTRAGCRQTSPTASSPFQTILSHERRTLRASTAVSKGSPASPSSEGSDFDDRLSPSKGCHTV